MAKTEFISKVIKFTGKRKVIEVPTKIRDNFKIGEYVYIKKIRKWKIKN